MSEQGNQPSQPSKRAEHHEPKRKRKNCLPNKAQQPRHHCRQSHLQLVSHFLGKKRASFPP